MFLMVDVSTKDKYLNSQKTCQTQIVWLKWFVDSSYWTH